MKKCKCQVFESDVKVRKFGNSFVVECRNEACPFRCSTKPCLKQDQAVELWNQGIVMKKSDFDRKYGK